MPIYMNLNEYEGGIYQIRNDLGISASLSNYPGLKKLRYNSDTASPYEVVFSTTNDGQFPLSLILRKSDLLLQGFITRQDKYYHFGNSTITKISDTTSVNLAFNSNYDGGLAYGAKHNLIISFASLNNAIKYLYHYDHSQVPYGVDKTTLVLMMLAVSEAVRFHRVVKKITDILDFVEPETIWGMFHGDLLNWTNYSKTALTNASNPYIASRLAMIK